MSRSVLCARCAKWRDLWKRMQALGIAEDFGHNLHDALWSELQNVTLRWEDAINDAEEAEERTQKEKNG
jgi:RNAse (barnase) inhibitor barstar